MRVVMVLGRSTGGIGTHVGQLRDDLRAVGVEVVVVTLASTARHFGWHDALTWWPDDGRSLATWPGRLRDLVRGADAVHAHGLQAATAVALGLGLGGRHRARVVVSLHNPPPTGAGLRGRVASALASWGLRRADLVTGASVDLVDLARRLGARHSVLAPVPSPSVPSLLDQPAIGVAERAVRASALGLGAGADRPLVLTVARAAPQKRLDLVVDAAALMRHGAHVVWAVAGAGDPAELTILRAAAESTGVRFLGARHDVPALLGAASALVVTSDWEARALVVQEAMAAGVPVVATEVGGIPGLLEGTGRLVRPGSARALAAALDGLVDDFRRDPDGLAAQGARGRVVAGSWPDGAATARQWRAWYSGPPVDDLD
ncbi:glycosyltransferase family 4 protein [Dermatophilaceae bacterium Soc4.6]